ncbi:MAG: hypothetical protein V3T83_22050 [Acidobacteriota bacterium]
MKGRVDSRDLSRQLAGQSEPSSELEPLSEEIFATMRDIDRSLDGILKAMQRESQARLPEGTRFSFFKSLMLRLLRLYTRGQDSYNQSTLEALSKIRRQQSLLQQELKRQQRSLARLLRDGSPGD